MRVAADVLLVLAGAMVVAFAIYSTVISTILPRGVRSVLARNVTQMVRTAFRVVADRQRTFEDRDRIMALHGPISLLALLLAWVLLIIFGYTAIYLGLDTHSPVRALELSGSSLTTLGTSATPKGAASLLTYTEAGLGLLVITLLISYLPSIYTAFSRREAGVAMLTVRAGTPPQATTVLIRLHRVSEPGPRFTELWRQWEVWFTDVQETHSTFPILAFFRSPTPEQSWVTAAGTVLDTAALWLSTIEHGHDADAQLLLRAGFLTLRRLADQFAIPHDPDPDPGDPISIGRSEYDGARSAMVDAGLAVRPDAEASWDAFRGWRVNYDTVLLQLARLVEAPYAPWVSDRSPVSERSSDGRRPTSAGGRRLRAPALRAPQGTRPGAARRPG